MAPLRIARPRLVAYFTLEGLIVFAVLWGLAKLSLSVAGSDTPDMATSVLLTGALFSVVLIATHWANLGDRASVVREVLIFSVISASVGCATYAGLWLVSGTSGGLQRLLLLEGAIAVPAVVALWRWISVRYGVFHALRENVLIVGTGEMARQVCRWIVTSHAAEYAVIGFAHEDDTQNGTVLAMGVRVQTDFDSLARFALPRADRVIVALDEKRGKLPVRQLMELRLQGLEIEEATSFFERISGKISIETLLPSWLIFSEGFKSSPIRSFLKRAADIFHSTLLLLVASPVMAVTALAVWLESGGPVLYRQSRLGRGGREFNMLKFRSMRKDAEMHSGPIWARENDPRVTRVGRVIRFLRIDELPQLFNVFRGEMSFVGPRPERGHFVRSLEEKIAYYGLRMTVRPGITGWAQVQYKYGSTVEDAIEKLKYDLYYIKNNNLLLDLYIVLKTIRVVLTGGGSR